MDDHTKTISTLRRFAPRDYRYQLDDAMDSLEPHTEATLACLAKALNDDDPDVRFLARQIIDELESITESITNCCEPKLTVEQLVTLLREPHPDHDFFDPEPDARAQQQLRSEYSADAIHHVALCELVEHRAAEAVPDILTLIESVETTKEVRLHAARAVFDITGRELICVAHARSDARHS